jgi:hypothetical protein
MDTKCKECGRHCIAGQCPNCSEKAKATREKRKKEKEAAKVGAGGIADDIFGSERTEDEAVE